MIEKEQLRIVFMGTPQFAVATLKALIDNGYPVVAVVTQPDRPVGRHRHTLQPSPVKEFALLHQLPVLQPERMKDEAFLRDLRGFRPNLQVVVAFRMLPEVVFALPEYGTFNVHASLLPRYRGAAPINWAIIRGETQTGVTTFFLDRHTDTGEIICQQTVPIAPEADFGILYDTLMAHGAQLALRTVDLIRQHDGMPPTQPQRVDDSIDDPQSLLAPKIFKDTCRIRWDDCAGSVANFVRGLAPAPAAWSEVAMADGTVNTLKILRARAMQEDLGLETGQMAVESGRLFAQCGDGTVEILQLQLAGKRSMEAREFLNGVRDVDRWTLQ